MPDKSLPTLATELWELVRDYGRQQLVEPLKGAGRFVAWGLAGGVLVGTGLLLLAIGLLRALQTQTGSHLDGNWSWAPYLVVLVASAAVLGLLASRMGKRKGTTR